MALLSVSRETNERFDNDAMTTERMRECDEKANCDSRVRLSMQQKRKTQAKIQVHTERKMNDTFMKEKPIIPLVAKMSLPVVLSMIINALYNFVDSIFVSKISENALCEVCIL